MKKTFCILIVILLAVIASSAPLLADCINEEILASATGSTITIDHIGAEWNCCANLAFELEETAEGFDLFEREVYGPEGPCTCICCFDLRTTIVDVPPGTYLIRVRAAEWDHTFGAVEVTVTGDPGKIANIGDIAQSACGGWEDSNPIDPSSWGMVKTLFR